MFRIISMVWLFLVFSMSLFPYIVKIGGQEIKKNEFQDFVDVQKFIDNQKTFQDLAEKKKTTKNNILTDYIDQKIVVKEALKKGYDKRNKIIKKAFAEKKERWVVSLYITKNVDIDSINVTDKDMQDTYNDLPDQSRTKSYSKLTEKEKQGLYQIASIKVAQDKKKEFQKKLEKKYKTVRYKMKNSTVAMVEGAKITQDELQENIDEQLARLGMTEKEIVDRDPKRFESAKKDILDEMIFDKLVDIDIKRSGFLKNKLVIRAYDFLMEQVISEQFILNEIANKLDITSQELDNAFVQIAQQNPAIKNMLPTEQERLLKNYIIQSKLPDIIKEYLVEIKESILIKRNKKELNSIT